MDEDECSDKTPLLGLTLEGEQDFQACSSRVVPTADSVHKAPYYHYKASNGVCETDTSPVGSSDIVCIFVVAFDIRAGNIIEWNLPNDCVLDGLEFKAMPSGSHCVETDFIYFKKGSHYGLACFQNMPVKCVEERGARMKSVGVLATSYTHLYKHKQFLQTQVNQLLHSPGNYDELLAFYEEEKGILLGTENALTSQDSNCGLPSMRITHPAGCFSQFTSFFGAKVFALWKAVLLKRRIIFFSPPPIGVACYRVYCTTSLVRHTSNLAEAKITQPLFYINISDIDVLDEESAYVACTTEKILESKRHLYDVYVDNQNLLSHCDRIRPQLLVNSTDKAKYKQIQDSRSVIPMLDHSVDREREAWFLQYFVNLNNRLFNTLFEISQSENKKWTGEHTKKLDLHPVDDAEFIKELIEVYGFDIEFSPQCCAC